MRVSDTLRFFIEMISSKFKQLRRIIMILVLGSSLVFSVVSGSHLLKSFIKVKYQGKNIVIPKLRNSNLPIEGLSFDLVSKNSIQRIEALFIGTKIKSSITFETLDIKNMRTFKEGSATVVTKNQAFFSVHESLMEYYDWNVGDLIRIGSVGFIIDKVHSYSNYDVLLPFYFQNSNTNNLRHNNILTIHSLHPIKDILLELNKSLVNSNYYYDIEPLSIDTLILSLIQLIEKLLFGITFCIFIVSSSNIGTLMPYFMMEYSDEIKVLRLLGMPRSIVVGLFLKFALGLLGIALLFSCLISLVLSLLLCIILGLPLSLPVIKMMVLLVLQRAGGFLFTQGSIKKATCEVAYL